MYNYIKGTLISADENTAVVEACGVGYELFVSSYTAERLGKIGNECKIYCYLNVQEDDMSLFGFADEIEKDFFKKLIGISGIGCKMAISILSSGSLSDIISAIAGSDAGKLSKIKGIGKKTAERIIVELHDKIAPGTETALFQPTAVVLNANNEAIEALLSLGYTRQEAQIAVARCEKTGMSTEEIVLAALKG